ncbi:MAG: chorismate synthase, partial [Streptosporangiaceae bacterium]|nr:chorismate synthase [Streptosporangiaceae bacterium]
MFRWLTAGESHGAALVAVCDGVPAGVRVSTGDIAAALARRRAGYGRGARMTFERDEAELTGGVRHGLTLGGPVAIRIGNTEWPKWQAVMSADPVNPEDLRDLARNAPLTRPRPGHADLAGMQKYGFDDARDVLERASARETAARVAAGTLAKALLAQLDIAVLSHVIQLGPVVSKAEDRPLPEDLETVDDSPVRCFDGEAEAAMVQEVKAAQADGDSLGGIVEVLAYGVPVGLGSHVHWDRKLDALLAQALMSIQAVKAVELGEGIEVASRRGSQAHDEIVWDADDRGYKRASAR